MHRSFYCFELTNWFLTHWGRVTHICVGNLTIIGSDNGLSPGRRQAIIWTNSGILLIGPLGTNFTEILIEIHIFSFTKMRFKVSSAKWRPFCFGLNVLTHYMLNFSEGTKTYFLLFFNTHMTQVVEIFPHVRQGPTYSTKSISWLLMSWRHKEPWHQQLWYWPSGR